MRTLHSTRAKFNAPHANFIRIFGGQRHIKIQNSHGKKRKNNYTNRRNNKQKSYMETILISELLKESRERSEFGVAFVPLGEVGVENLHVDPPWTQTTPGSEASFGNGLKSRIEHENPELGRGKSRSPEFPGLCNPRRTRR